MMEARHRATKEAREYCHDDEPSENDYRREEATDNECCRHPFEHDL